MLVIRPGIRIRVVVRLDVDVQRSHFLFWNRPCPRDQRWYWQIPPDIQAFSLGTLLDNLLHLEATEAVDRFPRQIGNKGDRVDIS
jgi:hypothetical protein